MSECISGKTTQFADNQCSFQLSLGKFWEELEKIISQLKDWFDNDNLKMKFAKTKILVFNKCF